MIVWVTAAAVALTRLFAISKTLWDWDEALFASALLDFNVKLHHPHPPGFPLFVAAAHVARLFTSSDFRALQVVNVIAAMLLVPLTFALARSLRMSFAESYVAASILAFLPNVWFYGGTAFSDVSALAVVIGAAAALFFSRWEEGRLYLAGCLLLGAAIAFRPQNALIGMYPWLSASWVRIRERRALEVTVGAFAVLAVALLSYTGAALASGSLGDYIAAVRMHEAYVRTVDSYRNPGRPPLLEALVMFINPYEALKLASCVWSLAVIGLLRMRRAAIETLLTFGPFFAFAWIMLDVFGASRLSIGFMPLLALLAAQGISTIASVMSAGRASFAAALQFVMGAAVVGGLIVWTVPALRVVRTTDSPPVAAARWIAMHVPPAGITLYVHTSLEPFPPYLLPNYRRIFVDDDFSGAEVANPRSAWLVAEGHAAFENGVSFSRPSRRLWQIVRHRYFDVFVRPLASWVVFDRGWYGQEGAHDDVWRWMSRRSVTRLSPGNGELRVRFHVPIDAAPKPPVVTISMNGQVLDKFTATSDEVDKTYAVAGNGAQQNQLVIETDQPVVPAQAVKGADTRELGLQLLALSWRPVS